VTGLGFTSAPASTAWGRYLNREHAARAAYLEATAQAHREHLTGPWPDRDTYERIERTAWTVYYGAGRAAWKTYRAEMDAEAQPAMTTLDLELADPGVSWLPEPLNGGITDPARTPTSERNL
jgi:hypothetical protein